MSTHRIVIGPNASLDFRGAVWFLGSLGALALTVAMVCFFIGFWPVLPFAGAELMAVTAAVWVSLRRNRYREVLSLDESRLRIEFGLAGVQGRGGATSSVDFPRPWVRVVIETGSRRHDPSRLLLCCSGQRVEIGRCLTDEERQALAARLKELISVKPAWGRSLPRQRADEPAV
ncbi:MAG: hypothetical protein JWQ90_5677 [Hydrocarboniphaga sp.]|uniref:DUF2244 domain-containing protein n=1 Tax=Hydrocarboniphaga sp. TaxID=2033016 RepID=UPI00260565D9|nr:DUF2244 domain-containing protein [Hydrocarboniphaga sp.]MDB5973227.1 hypothetical protein [Hydrocarboniphaga sp.]